MTNIRKQADKLHNTWSTCLNWAVFEGFVNKSISFLFKLASYNPHYASKFIPLEEKWSTNRKTPSVAISHWTKPARWHLPKEAVNAWHETEEELQSCQHHMLKALPFPAPGVAGSLRARGHPFTPPLEARLVKTYHRKWWSTHFETLQG